MADLQQNNIAAIRQWEGRAGLKFHASRSADDYDFTQTIDVRFSQDRVSDSICFEWVVTESFPRKRGHDDLINSLKGFRVGELQVGGDYYKMPLSPPDPSAVTIVLSERMEPNIGGVTQVFYPMSYFRIGDENHEQFFARLFRHSKESWMHMNIRQEGERVLLETGGPRYPQCRSFYVFDLSQSGLLVEFEGRDEHRGVSQIQEYQEFSGVFLPVYTLYRNAVHDGSEIEEKEVRWYDQRLNEPLPADRFTLEAMGAPAGASVVDVRTRRSYRYAPKGAATVVETSTAAASPGESTPESAAVVEDNNLQWWLWSILVFTFIIVALTLWFRRFHVSE